MIDIKVEIFLFFFIKEMDEPKFIERRMYEKKAQKIIERLAEETVNKTTLQSLVKFILFLSVLFSLLLFVY